jgi:hypothetical protein
MGRVLVKSVAVLVVLFLWVGTIHTTVKRSENEMRIAELAKSQMKP